MARISTHILDIAKGVPAAGIPVKLHLGGNLLASRVTNGDGRTDTPLLSADSIAAGKYELIFDVEDYLRLHHASAQPFFDRITLRFRVDDDQGHYHLPLLLSPFGYSTYRGS
jgi:5-hydroxyisourate hydrolase